ncbi:hypothetical protein C2S52_001104 [Perilla frutescens var. hirtella]|nr:hypothetical protein C2S51_007367 [Perilla frutescens var. frutescens]KAH6800640.1 hypothetical protein C2S52_001104 [Perilla frutescens var. hirtella]
MSVVEHFAKLADFRARVEEMSQGQHLHDSAKGDGGGIDMSSLFVDVVGISEKKSSSGESHSSTSQVNANVINNFEDRLQILENQLRESQEQLQKEREDAKRQMKEVLQQQMEQHQ